MSLGRPSPSPTTKGTATGAVQLIGGVARPFDELASSTGDPFGPLVPYYVILPGIHWGVYHWNEEGYEHCVFQTCNAKKESKHTQNGSKRVVAMSVYSKHY